MALCASELYKNGAIFLGDTRAKIHLGLTSYGEVLIDDVGHYTGLEVHGNVKWLMDSV